MVFPFIFPLKEPEENKEEEADVNSSPEKDESSFQSNKKKMKKTSEGGKMVLNMWWAIFMTVVVLTFGVRLYNLEGTTWVCWDETHFGKMGSWYINRTMYFDVHPPLGKLMIAGMGWMTGYNGSFPFLKPGDDFVDHKVMGMRYGCTIFGILTVPLGFLTVWELTEGSLSAATLAALFLTFDNGMAVINRYILLDPLMIFFISISVFAMVKFRKCSNTFSYEWWGWLTLTGSMLAGAISVKFVGLFVIALVGIYTAIDLWNLLGSANSWTDWIRHLYARVICLILLPILLYISTFIIHFSVLSKSGPGDGHYSSLFQSSLEGSFNSDSRVPQHVAYGDILSVRAGHNMPCVYLHSHTDLYPEGYGSRQQVVSSYMHRDENNMFIIKKEDDTINNTKETEYVKHGDLIRLEHLVTGRNLHSHNIKVDDVLTLTDDHYQVTGYGDKGEGDSNDLWILEVVGGQKGDLVKSMTSQVRFHHNYLQCLLTCTGKQLPKDWGFGQQEVTCSPYMRHTKEHRGFHNKEWFFEDVRPSNKEREMLFIQELAPSFWSKLKEAHRMMFYVNNRLTSDKENKAEADNDPKHYPWKWPLNILTQIYSPKEPRIYMLGNPAIWGINLVILIVFPLFLIFKICYIRRWVDDKTTNNKDSDLEEKDNKKLVDNQQNAEDNEAIEEEDKQQNNQQSNEIQKEDNKSEVEEDDQTFSPHMNASILLLSGWSLHYLPFYLMARVLYIHHYYPAVYFSSLMSGVVLDMIIRQILRLVPHQVRPVLLSGVVVTISIGVMIIFSMFSPLVYGMSGSLTNDVARFSNSSYHHLYWIESWDF